jgi:hypothetical protein
MLKKIVDTLLKEAGSTLKFDDLFEIHSVPNGAKLDRFTEWVQEEKAEDMGYPSHKYPDMKELAAFFKKNPKLEKEWYDAWAEDEDGDGWKNDDNPRYKDGIAIVRKDGSDTGLADMIEKVFSSQEVHD